MTLLGDFTSPDRLKELVEQLTDEGRRNHCFENFSIQNISKWIFAGGFPKETMSIYGYPTENPLYIFMLEQNEFQFEILTEGLKEIYALALPSIEKHGEILLEADTVVRATFFKLQESGYFPFTTKYSGDFYPFYMNESQKRTLIGLEITPPDGFKIDSVDVENEYNSIHFAWPYAANAPVEITRLRLANLPSVCIRNLEGNLASWEMSHHFGQLTHLFTFEPYRGKGIGLLAEILLAQIYAKSGLHVYKYVADHNDNVLRGSNKHPLWSLWKSTKNEEEREESDQDIMWSFNIFTYVKH
ncbi:hypothetical protein PRIPAC_80853 [Pristionchus pacificus]|nr:hypothetical protein PRIPAC_80853 [Pristionchus pacificus]